MNATPEMMTHDATLTFDSPGRPTYFSVAEAASFIGVSRVTIWRWVKAGRLPIWKLGHRTARVKREGLERLLVARELGRGGVASARAADVMSVGDTAIAATGASPDDHIVQFYAADGVLMAAVAEYIGAGL